jgi:hypothetical protein
MSRMWFEATIPVFGRAKPFHALDCAANVIGYPRRYGPELNNESLKEWKISASEMKALLKGSVFL